MLEGFVDWPEKAAERYRSAGLWEGVTITEMVERSARRSPDKIALIFEDQRISYAELMRRSKALAIGFATLGIAAQDRVVVQLPNIPEFVTVYLALTSIGAIPVMALRAHRHAEVRHFLNSSAATTYVIADVVSGFDYRSMASEMREQCSTLRHVVVVGEPGPDQIDLRSLVSGSGSGDEVDRRLRPMRPSPGDAATMLLSGGTTSMSKLIPRTHDEYVLNARLCGAAAGFGANTVFLALLPLGHNYNLASPGILGTFYFG
jgi:2,3-dihydroxybenzoate-AMP ligase